MRIVPSDIVGYIDKVFPKAAEYQDSNKLLDAHAQHSAELRTIIELVDQLDPGYLPARDALVQLEAARQTINTYVGRGGDPLGRTDKLGQLRGYEVDPILAIRKIMQSLPDQMIPEESSGLEFVEDEALRTDLRADIASVERLLNSGEWKATMVIAGGVMEALLLHALLEHGEETAKERAANLDPPVKGDPADWHLPAYVKVAQHLKIITQECAKQTSIAGDCRNLIHPGKQYREGRKVTRKDAYSAVAGLQHVVESVTAWWEARVRS